MERIKHLFLLLLQDLALLQLIRSTQLINGNWTLEHIVWIPVNTKLPFGIELVAQQAS